MKEISDSDIGAMTSVEMAAKEKILDLRLKELEVANKEYQHKHRPSREFSTWTNPGVIAAMIAAWATLSAGLITWYSGKISADAQQIEAAQKADQAKLDFEKGTIIGAMNNVDNQQLATRLELLVEAGLITGDLADKVKAYISAGKLAPKK
jgi:hypothetical protein